jgi:hypothetical protein
VQKNTIIILICFAMAPMSYAQIGGRGVFGFLDLPVSARVSALGGKQIALMDGDINMAYYNPSLADPSMQEKLAVNYVNYFAGINWGNTSYMFHNKKLGQFVAGLTYMNYGKFTAADETGMISGQFRASDYALYASYARPLDSNFVIGVNLKPVFSQMESYYSVGIATDWAITYTQPEKEFTASLVIRNVGSQITTYSRKNYEPLPFEIQLGASKKLAHAPFRFCLMLHNLQRFDYTYDLEEEEDVLGGSEFFTSSNEQSDFAEFADKAFRHVVLGVEFIPTKSFVFRFGYNYQRLKEMQIEEKLGGVGLSWGFGLLLNKFHINYGRATYHMAGASNNFSITANLAALRGI